MSIFSCDNFAIYSSISMELAPGVLTRRVSSTLLTELGGSFMTVLNLGPFMAVWKQVLYDGEYLHHDWILKAEDALFLGRFHDVSCIFHACSFNFKKISEVLRCKTPHVLTRYGL